MEHPPRGWGTYTHNTPVHPVKGPQGRQGRSNTVAQTNTNNDPVARLLKEKANGARILAEQHEEQATRLRNEEAALLTALAERQGIQPDRKEP